MKLTLPIIALVAIQSVFAQTNGTAKFFPYQWTADTLSNGLRVVTVPTEHKNLVALYLIVRVGSRNEVEEGKSGFAHFFEHMMFRGSQNFTPDQRDAIMKKAGAEANAYTTGQQWLPKIDRPPTAGSAHRVLTYDADSDTAVWEGATVKRSDPIPE